MNWEIVGSTGEWVGAFFVGLSLIYLAVQIRQQNRIARFATWESLVDGANQQLINATPEKIAGYLKGRNHPAECSETEILVYQNGLRIYFNNTHKAFRAYKNGLLPQEEWEAIGKVFRAEVNTPGGEIWRRGNEEYARDFFQAVDSLQGETTVSLDLLQKHH